MNLKLNKKEKVIFYEVEKIYREIFGEIILEYGKENKLSKEEIHNLMDLKGALAIEYVTLLFREWLKKKKGREF